MCDLEIQKLTEKLKQLNEQIEFLKFCSKQNQELNDKVKSLKSEYNKLLETFNKQKDDNEKLFKPYLYNLNEIKVIKEKIETSDIDYVEKNSRYINNNDIQKVDRLKRILQ